MTQILALFSGQGSQYPGMGKELYDRFAQVRELYECAGDIFGFDVAGMSFTGDEEALAQTGVVQPVTYTLSVAAYTVAKELLPAPAAVAGHSLGEFAALACAGAYSIEDGMRIVKIRAAVMDRVSKQRPGAMYAILGGDVTAIEQACRDAGGIVQCANYNIPSQTVISGEAEACARAAQMLIDSGAKAVPVKVSGAFHTPLMQEAADELREGIKDFAFAAPSVDFYSNVAGGKLVIDDYPDYFARHMVSPVRFVEEMAAVTAAGIDTCVEFGPKKTASTLAKKSNRAFTVLNVEDNASLDKAVAAFA